MIQSVKEIRFVYYKSTNLIVKINLIRNVILYSYTKHIFPHKKLLIKAPVTFII